MPPLKRDPFLERWIIALAFISCFVWIFLAILHPLQDPDLWWHLASGREMLQHHHIPSHDVFSSTAAGTRWINSYWLYDVFVYWVYTRLGFNGLTFLHAALVLGFFYVADLRLREKETQAPWRLAALAALFCGAAPSGGYWGPQASLVSLFLASLLLYHMERWKRRGWTRGLWGWVPLFLLWANLHRGFLLGLGIAGCYVLDDKEKDQAVARRWLWLLLCAGVTFLTPHPVGLFQMIWDDLTFSSELITGWLAPALPQLKIFACTLPLFWILFLSRSKALWRSWPLVLLAALFTIGSLRHLVYVSYFMLIAVPEIAARLSSFTAERASWSKEKDTGAAAVFLGLFLIGIFRAHPVLGIQRLDVFDFIKNEKIEGPFYNDYLFGGAWMWAFGGDPPVFIDGRYPAVEGYKPLAREIMAANRPVSWNRLLDRYHIETALVKYSWESPQPSVFEAIFPRRLWALVYWDDACALFVRRGNRNAAVIARNQFLHVWPDAKRAYAVESLRAMSVADRRHFLEELLRNAQLHPESRHTQAMLRLFTAQSM